MVHKKLWFLLAVMILVTGVVNVPASAQTSGDDSTFVVRVYFSKNTDVDQLADSLDTLEVDRDNGWLLAEVTSDEYTQLKKTYRVVIDKNYTAALSAPLQEQTIQEDASIPGKSCIHTVEEILASMNALANKYPSLVEKIDIGDSWKKQDSGGSEGYDLVVLKITNKTIPGPKPALFLMGSTHGTEVFSGETALLFGKYILKKYNVDANITAMLDNYELHLLPIYNPDGYKIAETGFKQRKNDDRANGECPVPSQPSSMFGIDLNRNSSFHWDTNLGSSEDPCNNHYRGPSAQSEPETQAMENYVSIIFADRRGDGMEDAAPDDYQGMFISLHTPGKLVMYPWGETRTLAPNYTALSILAQGLASFPRYRPGATSYLTNLRTGESAEWAYGTLGVPAFTIEMEITDGALTCSKFTKRTYPAIQKSLVYAFKNVHHPYLTPTGPEVSKISSTIKKKETDRSGYSNQ